MRDEVWTDEDAERRRRNFRAQILNATLAQRHEEVLSQYGLPADFFSVRDAVDESGFYGLRERKRGPSRPPRVRSR